MKEELTNLIRAGFSGLYLISQEEQRVEQELRSACKEAELLKPCDPDKTPWQFHIWSITAGILQSNDASQPFVPVSDCQDPLAVLDEFLKLPERSVLALRDYHLFIGQGDNANPLIIRKLKDVLMAGRTSNRVICIIGCRLVLPPEIEKEVTVLEFQLPNRADLLNVLSNIAESAGIHLNGNADALVDASMGLTTREAEDAASKSYIQTKDLDPSIIAKYKADTVKKGGLLEVVNTNVTISEIGGLERLKQHLNLTRNLFTRQAREFGLDGPRPLLLCGQPGCLHGDTQIYDPILDDTYTVRERYKFGIPFHVYSMAPNGERVMAETTAPFKYPPAEMRTLELSNGEFITVTLGHRFMTPEGWRTCSEVCELQSRFGRVRLVSTLGTFQPASSEDGLSSTQTERGSRSDYQWCCRSHDEQLHRASGIDRAFAPSQAGVQARNQIDRLGDCGQTDVEGNEPARNHHLGRCFSRRAIGNYGDQRNALRSQCASKNTKRDSLKTQSDLRSPSKASQQDTFDGPVYLDPQSKPTVGFLGGVSECQTVSPLRKSPALIRGTESKYPEAKGQMNTLQQSAGEQDSGCVLASVYYDRIVEVVNVKDAGVHEYYDFHVPFFENYEAAGVMNHNTGKSLSASATASVYRIPLLRLEAGRLFGSLVGQTEQNWRSAFGTAKAIAPCILWIDEVDGLFSGAASSGQTDGGTTSRLCKTILQDIQFCGHDILFFFTANDIDSLPDPLVDRCDVWSVDLPNMTERASIWGIHIKKRKRDPKGFDLIELARISDGFSGRQIEMAWAKAMTIAFNDEMREPKIEDVRTVLKDMQPTSVTMADAIDRRRKRLSGKAQPASTPDTGAVVVAERKLS